MFVNGDTKGQKPPSKQQTLHTHTLTGLLGDAVPVVSDSNVVIKILISAISFRLSFLMINLQIKI